MRKIEAEELAAWCERSGYALENWRPSLPSAVRRLDLPLPSAAEGLAELLDDLVSFADAPERLVWLRDWTIWDDRPQDIGLRHLALLTGGSTAPQQGLEAYVLPASEWRETITLLTVPALYGWDAHARGSGHGLDRRWDLGRVGAREEHLDERSRRSRTL